MKTCTKHAHSSEDTAQSCWNRLIGKKADKRMLDAGAIRRYSYTQVKHNPPKLVQALVPIIYFYSGEENG